MLGFTRWIQEGGFGERDNPFAGLSRVVAGKEQQVRTNLYDPPRRRNAAQALSNSAGFFAKQKRRRFSPPPDR